MLQRTSIQSIRISQLFRSSSCYKRQPCIRQAFARSCFTIKYLGISATTRSFSSTRLQHNAPIPDAPKKSGIRENIYTLPNLLTLSRICSCPILAWSIVDGNYYLATGLLAYAGLTDAVDGYLARRYNMSSVLGTVLDPAADKILMTTLVLSLTHQDLIPVPLAVIILGRDVLLSLSAFYIRYSTLPPPKTWVRYWDVSLPSAEVRPTYISKVNTTLQLVLMGVTTVNPILPFDLGLALQGLQYIVATTTIWSGFSYLVTKNAFRVVSQTKNKTPNSP
ncbi:Cardiolipin synthase (CMP-forming) [Psilocybe cubensis]|uniref:Cardiolipin synthase (CMP-forming) n=1 Tax=Psilocybe cubensis TaxID=181762 RepID=A0ACB8GWJ7_PSICU|nr:Cardiolipin synthase (CMP-forming) [Psilocybe cubensis]KAH9479345.1 Cardiolipin synthase (CMP-forming) [Psilocybe cubensis]